jgi:hypothetical protein
MNISVPVDGRRQFPMATVVMANASLGRMPFEGVEPVGYGSGLYTIAGQWPTPKPTPTNSFSSAVASTQPVPETAPKSSVAARSIWPNLR